MYYIVCMQKLLRVVCAQKRSIQWLGLVFGNTWLKLLSLLLRATQPSCVECGLLHLPSTLFWIGILPHLPSAPEVPVYQVRGAPHIT